MAALTVQTIPLLGVQKATLVAAATAGDTFVNDGKTIFEVNNADVSATTVTITGQRNLPLDTSSTKTVSVAASTTQSNPVSRSIIRRQNRRPTQVGDVAKW